MNLDELIGERVKTYRKKVGISQEALGARLKDELGSPWTRQTVWEAEKGRRSFKVVELIALARVIGRPVHFFLIPRETETVDWPGVPPLTATDLKDLFRYQGTRPGRADDVRRVMELIAKGEGWLHGAIEQLKLMDDQLYDMETGKPTGQRVEGGK